MTEIMDEKDRSKHQNTVLEDNHEDKENNESMKNEGVIPENVKNQLQYQTNIANK